MGTFIVITLLYLKNAFGEVHHNLISEVLKYHHTPDHIQVLISSLYSNFQTSISSNSFQTPVITVGRGVLQGDCLSPLTFNLCFNTFINYISAQKFNQFGFSIGSLSLPSTGFSLLMTLPLLQVLRRKLSYYSITSHVGALGQT